MAIEYMLGRRLRGYLTDGRTGGGMPVRREGQIHKKGNLIAKWEIVFPDRLC
jgi:hypothetical protein